jgi:hypothetical protein
MSDFDRVLAAASRADVEEALRSAAAHADAGQQGQRLGWPPPGLADVLRRVADEPEGRAQLLGGRSTSNSTRSALAVAWWHDHLGRPHLRVVAGRRRLRPTDAPFLPVGWPPLCLIHPEPTLARPGGALALCACGAWGEPRSLGWMGDRCGPCHDRGPDASQRLAAWPLPALGELVAASLAPDGSALAVQFLTGQVVLLDPETGAIRGGPCVALDNNAVNRLEAAPGGRLVAVDGVTYEGWEVVVWDMVAGRRVVSLPLGWHGAVFTPDGRALCAVSDRERPVAYALPDGPARELDGPEPAWAVAVQADGALAALFGDELGDAVALWSGDAAPTFYHLPSRAARDFGWHPRPPFFGPDGRLYVLCDHGAVLRDVVRGVTVARLSTTGATEEAPQLTSDGRALLVAGECWQAWALPRGRSKTASLLFARRRRFSRDLAVLPDGRLLTLDADGRARLWPAEVFSGGAP